MKKKLVKRKKAQFGTITNQIRPRQDEPNYNWMDFDETAFPSIPGAVNPINQMPIIAQGTDTGETANNIPLRSNPDGSYSFQRTQGTGVTQDNPFVTGFNALATGITGIANTIQNNRLKKREQMQMIEANEPKYWENMEGAGLNNLPMYTQYGGKTIRKYRAGGHEPSVAKAKEMLRDGTVNGKPLTEKQKGYFGWIAGGKKQTGGPNERRRLAPEEMQQWNQFLEFVKEQGYEGSPELNVKNKNLGSSLFDKFKTANPNVTIDYSIVPDVQNEMQVLGQSARDFAARRNDPNAANLMTGVSPVDSWFGSKTSQYRFPSATLVTKRNNQTVGQQNLGLVSGNIQATGVGNINKPRIPQGVQIETLYDDQGNAIGKGYTDPTTGDTIELKYGGRNKKGYQSGGVPEGHHVMPDGSIMSDDEMSEEGMYNMSSGNVEAEQGEIVEGENGRIVKVSDTSKRHEQGGVKLNNVSRVLEDTSNKRKDKASKMLKLSPEEMESLFGFRPKSSVSHSKAFELAKEHYDGKRDKINKNNKLINDRTKIDKYGAKSAELNFKTLQDIPTEDDVYDALFMHQESVKDMNDIEDDGSMGKHGGKYNVRGRRVSHHRKSRRKAQAGTESEGFSRPARGKGYYFDEATQRWYAPGDVPSAAAIQQAQQVQNPSAGGITPYQGGRTSSGRTTPTGNPNQFNFPGGLDAYKSAWSPVLDLSQYNDVNEAQQATYNYLVQNQPDVAANIWETQGLTQKGRDMMNPKNRSYDQGFARIAANIFDSTGKLKQGVKLTPDQLQALTPAYSDNMLGVRAVTPSQTTQTTGQVAPGSTQPSAAASGQPLDTSANINPNFIKQPANQFKEGMYWDELAAPLMALTEGRDAELYNPVQLNQLRYKLLDPTAAMNANQADFNAVAQGLDPANTANLLGNKYAANAQIMANYDNQNTQIKNREIDYNTGVRDRQSVADASTRGTYHRNVQLSREAQRQQRLKAIEDISRAIQMKRRQNKSGNLILKMSPAFDQSGEYNGYQYAPILPTDLGINSQLPVITPPKKTSSTKTTTTWKIGDRTIRTENKG